MRRWLVILALPLLFWSAYWGAGAYTLKQGMESMLQGQQHGMLSSHYTTASVRGFPTDFQVNMSDLELGQTEGMFSWLIPQIELHAPSYQPQKVRLEITGEQRVETTLGALVIGASLFEIGVFLRPALNWPLGRAQLQLEGASLAHEQGEWLLGLERLLIDFQDISGTNQNSPVPYQMTLAAAALDLSELGWDLPSSHQEIESLRADLRLGFSDVWDRSVLEQGMPRLQTLLIRGIALRLGDSEITMAGQLARTPDGLMSGELAIDILNWRVILNILRQAEYIDPDIAGLIEELMAVQDTGEERVQLPLTFDDGMISLGVFTLGFLPILP